MPKSKKAPAKTKTFADQLREKRKILLRDLKLANEVKERAMFAAFLPTLKELMLVYASTILTTPYLVEGYEQLASKDTTFYKEFKKWADSEGLKLTLGDDIEGADIGFYLSW